MVSKILRAGILFPALIMILNISVFADILKDVKSLKVGIDDFYIGEELNNITQFQKIKKTFTGTEKYKTKDLFITVSKKEKIIIGLYKKFDNVTKKELKKTISFLMMKFGEPTLEAHGKDIYWFYSKKGKISNKDFLDMRKKGKIVKPILMVKFHSDTLIDDKKNKNFKFYYIIYSEPLIRFLLKK